MNKEEEVQKVKKLNKDQLEKLDHHKNNAIKFIREISEIKGYK